MKSCVDLSEAARAIWHDLFGGVMAARSLAETHPTEVAQILHVIESHVAAAIRDVRAQLEASIAMLDHKAPDNDSEETVPAPSWSPPPRSVTSPEEN